MKKLHFSLMAILFALFAMVSFTACSSSDDDDTPSTESIKEMLVGGRWIPTHISGWVYIGSDYEPGDDGTIKEVDKDLDYLEYDDEYDAITFKNDITCRFSYYSKYNHFWVEDKDVTYSVYGNRVCIYYDDDTYVYNVLSINTKKMVVEYDLDEDCFPGKKVRLTLERK